MLYNLFPILYSKGLDEKPRNTTLYMQEDTPNARDLYISLLQATFQEIICTLWQKSNTYLFQSYLVHSCRGLWLSASFIKSALILSSNPRLLSLSCLGYLASPCIFFHFMIVVEIWFHWNFHYMCWIFYGSSSSYCKTII